MINPEQPYILTPCWMHEYGMFGFLGGRIDNVVPMFLFRKFLPSEDLHTDLVALLSHQVMKIEGVSPSEFARLVVNNGYLRGRIAVKRDGERTAQLFFQPIIGELMGIDNIPQLQSLLKAILV